MMVYLSELGVGVLSYLTTSILPLRVFMHQFGIFVKNGDGGYKLSDQFYSANSRNYAPLWYLDVIGVGGYRLSDHYYSAPPRIYAPIWYICREWGWGYKLSDHFYSAPSQV